MVKNSLCKECDECKDYEYVRYDKKGNLITFLYCEGGKEEVGLSKWYIQKDGYAYSTGRINGRKIFYHTLFKKDKYKVIDHVNGQRNDNRLRKLREITPLCNNQNYHDNKRTSRFPGVHWNRKRECWVAQTKQFNSQYSNKDKFNSKSKGGFKSELEAFDWYVRTLRADGRTVNTSTKEYHEYEKWLSEKAQTTLI